ncbi:putative siderophore-binding lipoprotein YfiY [Paenibacillus solanacearum]|uniref:Siderophore-binding lipoprotein YfiY n=1 Tax=Paenibacillus solanacearum TaxID=2048548 RepID=A0A916KAB2_9BACL|nr:iron-siderophore ABC transporter substrate-binding protein [Paenibacillus solanacearum]CAG7650943.1 putative siderophore-binding lipoprotein YfiY [Paenibacillus solanacearum]
MKAFRMIVIMLLVLAVAGCGTNANGGTKNGSAPTSTGASDPKGTGQPAGGEGERTIKHAMGTVTLKKKPERVVVLFNGMVDIAIALGVKPVGAVESWDQKPWYQYLRSNMDGVKNLGDESQPNVEAILALKPDLIIGNKTRHEKIYPQLSSIAPTIITEEVFNWKENLKISANALYKDKEAEKILGDWNKRVADFKQKAGSRLANTEVSILRFEDDGSARIYVTGFAGTIFEELGIGRPKAQKIEGKTVVNLTSKEQMSQLDADYIFDITQVSEGNASKVKSQSDWTNHPLWKNLKGVKNGKYFKVDVVTWNLSGGVLAANKMLDDVFKMFDIK